MKLHKFTVTNFRGIDSLEIEPNGKDVNFYGANGTGKTTTEDAFLWLLFGKDSSDRRDYDLIPHVLGGALPDVGQGKEPTVEAVLEHDEKIITLKKAYLEDVPTRGEYKGQYVGSKVNYYVDDLQVKAGEYQKTIAEIIEEPLFKLITNPVYFLQNLTWQERRTALKGLIEEELQIPVEKDLAELMGERSFENFHLLAKQNVKTSQKALEGLPVSIKEAMRTIPSELPVLLNLAELLEEKENLENQLLSLKANDAGAKRLRALSELEAKLLNAENLYMSIQNVGNDKTRNLIEELNRSLQEFKTTLNQKVFEIRSLTLEIDSITNLKSEKLKQYYEVSALQWTGSEECPTCEQVLPAEQIERAKALFNTKRATDLEKIKVEGKSLKSSLEGKTELLARTQKEFDDADANIAELEKQIAEQKATLTSPNFKMTDEYKSIRADIEELSNQDQTSLLQKNIKNELSLEMKLEEVKAKISADTRNQLIIEQSNLQNARVAALKEEEVRLNAEVSHWERAVYLCGKHVKSIAIAIEEAVNNKFKIAKFQLFALQKNGEETEVCEVVYPNGSTNLSTGERLQVGVDIINTFSAFYGITAPIFVDNAESVSLSYETESQLIRLVVSPDDKKLRWEVVEHVEE